MPDQTEYEAAFDAGRESVVAVKLDPEWIEGLPYAAIRGDLKLVKMEDFLPSPVRRRAKAVFTDAASFCSYIEDFRGDSILVTADRAQGQLVARLDYHGRGIDGPASWNTHEATLKLQHSPEWLTWTKKDRQQQSQVEFAEFLEQNLPDIEEPDGAVFIEAALDLEAKRTVNFKRAHNLTNGLTQFFYEEAEDGKGKGEVKLPREFTLAISPYEHTDPVLVKARLRYRISDEGKLTFTYVLDRPHKAIETAFAEVITYIAGATGIRPLLGTVTPL